MTAEEDAAAVSAWWLLAPGLLFGANFVLAATQAPSQTNLVYHLSDVIATAVLDLVLAGYALIAVAASHKPVRATLALRLPVSRHTAMRLAAATLVALVALDLISDPLLGSGRKQGIAPTHAPNGEHQWIVLGIAAVAVVVIAPVAEELIFRGLSFAALGRYALPGSAALFAMAHGLPILLAPIFVAGLALGWLRRRTASLYPSLAVHMSLNAIALAVALFTA